MTEAAFDKLVAKSRRHLNSCQERLGTKFKIGSYKRFDFRQEDGQLVFSDARRRARVIADFQVVGTLSIKPRTWRWAWANKTILPALRKQVLEVRRFGRTNKLPLLLQEEWDADESDGWDMTALAVQLLKAEGAYRAPYVNGLCFLALTQVAWAPLLPNKRLKLTGAAK